MSDGTTPRPWQVDPDHAFIIQKDAPGIADHHDSYSVADVRIHSLISVEEARANAALIVKCVNAHDDLVKALEHMIADCEAYHISCTCGPNISEHEHNNMAFARSALEKAKAK